MKKIKRKTVCVICEKLRIVTYYPESKNDRKEFLEEIKQYICSDCERKK